MGFKLPCQSQTLTSYFRMLRKIYGCVVQFYTNCSDRFKINDPDPYIPSIPNIQYSSTALTFSLLEIHASPLHLLLIVLVTWVVPDRLTGIKVEVIDITLGILAIKRQMERKVHKSTYTFYWQKFLQQCIQ